MKRKWVTRRSDRFADFSCVEGKIKTQRKMVRRDFDLTEYFDNISEMSLLDWGWFRTHLGVLIRSNAGYDVVFNLPGENQSLLENIKKSGSRWWIYYRCSCWRWPKITALLNDGAQVTSDSLFDGSGNLKGGLSLRAETIASQAKIVRETND